MGTHPRPAARFVAGVTAAAAALSLSSLTSSTPIKNPPTLARDANNPCRVRIIEYSSNQNKNDSFQAINLDEIAKNPFNKNTPDPLKKLSILYDHASLVEAQITGYGTQRGVNIQTEIHKVVPHFEGTTPTDFEPFQKLATEPRSIVNFSWGAFYPGEKDWAGFMNKIDPSYAGSGSFQDARQRHDALVNFLTNPREDNRFRPESERWLGTTLGIFEQFHGNGSIIVRSAGNAGKEYLNATTTTETYSPLSLPPYVNSVMALEANGEPAALTSQGTHAENASITIKGFDPKGTSVILSNGLVLPIQERINSPDGRSVSYRQITTPLPPDVQSRLIGVNLFAEGSQTSMAAPILSAKLAVACEQNRSANPNKPAEQLLEETAQQVLMQGRGR